MLVIYCNSAILWMRSPVRCTDSRYPSGNPFDLHETGLPVIFTECEFPVNFAPQRRQKILFYLRCYADGESSSDPSMSSSRAQLYSEYFTFPANTRALALF